MSKLHFVTEEVFRDLINSEISANRDRGHITGDPNTFVEHCVDTGNVAYEITKKILEKHPELLQFIHPEILRVYGYMHDFGKIYEGYKYHEVVTAHLIWTQGNKNLALVVGGSSTEHREVLREIASIAPPDFALYESLGAENFPDDAVYKDRIDGVVDRVNADRRDWSRTSVPLTMQQYALPFTLHQCIGFYADFTNVHGKKVTVPERINELLIRKSDVAKKDFDPDFTYLMKKAQPRLIGMAKYVESLL